MLQWVADFWGFKAAAESGRRAAQYRPLALRWLGGIEDVLYGTRAAPATLTAD